MKTYKKFLSVLCALCMVAAMAAPAFAAPGPIVRSSTPSTEVKVDTNNGSQLVIWSITDSYGFYKVWFRNTTNRSTIRVALYKGSPSGTLINYMDVPAGQTMTLHNADENSPLQTDTYYLDLTVLGGGENLSGPCFHKNANTYADVI